MNAPDPWDWFMAAPFLAFVALVVMAVIYFVATGLLGWLRTRK